ncbi:MAG: DNA repair protein RecO [Porphyromonadaceae bacterium]|nr:DNA repair protein RecO [Porphyromonadaceae bacterium]
MFIQTPAIVLHSTAYNDRYIIVHLYTREHGRLNVLVPRGGRSRSRHHLLFSPLAEVDLTAELKPRRDLALLKEVKILTAYHTIRIHPAKCSQAIFLSELLYRILSQPEADQALYDYIASAMHTLEMLQSGVANFYLCFTYHLLHFLAVAPEIQRESGQGSTPWFDLAEACFTPRPRSIQYALSPHEAAHLRLFARIRFDNLSAFRYNRHDRAIILDRLMLFYRLHLPAFPTLRSIEILRSATTASPGSAT